MTYVGIVIVWRVRHKSGYHSILNWFERCILSTDIIQIIYGFLPDLTSSICKYFKVSMSDVFSATSASI